MLRYRFFISIILVVCIIFSQKETIWAIESGAKITSEAAPQDSELYAKAAVLMDGSSGRVLFGKAEDEKLPMASTTKIMTCILALEYGDMKMECEVSALAAQAPKVKLGAASGRRFLLEDLLYSLMLESHNDTAVVIAEAVGGSVEGFSVLMNQKAEEIGLLNTSFVTPNGLDAEGHYTTASDLALLLRYCIVESSKNQEFLTITRRQSYTFSDLDGAYCFTVNNHNAFLTMMNGALTGKTGFTGKAGYCYVGALERDGKLFIVSLLACGWPNNRTYKWHDTKLLMNYALKEYQMEEYQIQSGVPEMIPVINGVYDWAGNKSGAFVSLETNCPESVRYLLGRNEKIETRLLLEKTVEAPVRNKTEVGCVQIWVGDTCMESYPVWVTESVEEMNWKWYVRQTAEMFFRNYK